MFRKDREASYQLTEKFATFSLDNAQLEIGFLTNLRGDKVKGIDLVFPSQLPAGTGPRGTYSYLLRSQDVEEFEEFLNQVISHKLPADYQFTNDLSDRWFSDGDCHWKVTKYIEKWHGGGGYRGWIDNSWSYTITKASLLELRNCVRMFFEDST